MNRKLLEMGLSGEGCIDDKVWVVKSHYPERIGRTFFKANKCIVIVRNPLDCIFSLFHMVGTSSHEASLEDDLLERALKSKIWDEFVEQES